MNQCVALALTAMIVRLGISTLAPISFPLGQVFVDTDLPENPKGGPYIIVPTTFDPGQERAFTMNLGLPTILVAMALRFVFSKFTGCVAMDP